MVVKQRYTNKVGDKFRGINYFLSYRCTVFFNSAPRGKKKKPKKQIITMVVNKGNNEMGGEVGDKSGVQLFFP